MRALSLGEVLKAAVVAGLVAGLLVALFHFVLSEPVIEQAIAREEQLRGTGEAGGEPLVSRDLQRAGLFVGFLLYSLTWSLLFAVVYHLGQRWLPPWSAPVRGFFLAAAGFWSVGLFPFLKYPANPPGVGEPETIAYRQSFYFGLLGLSLIGTAITFAVGRYLSRFSSLGLWRWLLPVGLLMMFAGAVYMALPANPDPVSLPADLVFRFRLQSLVGLALFWSLFGVTFAWIVRRVEIGKLKSKWAVNGVGP